MLSKPFLLHHSLLSLSLPPPPACEAGRIKEEACSAGLPLRWVFLLCFFIPASSCPIPWLLFPDPGLVAVGGIPTLPFKLTVAVPSLRDTGEMKGNP